MCVCVYCSLYICFHARCVYTYVCKIYLWRLSHLLSCIYLWSLSHLLSNAEALLLPGFLWQEGRRSSNWQSSSWNEGCLMSVVQLYNLGPSDSHVQVGNCIFLPMRLWGRGWWSIEGVAEKGRGGKEGPGEEEEDGGRGGRGWWRTVMSNIRPWQLNILQVVRRPHHEVRFCMLLLLWHVSRRLKNLSEIILYRYDLLCIALLAQAMPRAARRHLKVRHLTSFDPAREPCRIPCLLGPVWVELCPVSQSGKARAEPQEHNWGGI